jgi:Co/Zn/Cd efflux system component
MSEETPLLPPSPPSSNPSKKPYGERRRRRSSEPDPVLLAEGAGEKSLEDDNFMILLAVMSFLMTVVAVIYAVKANSMAVVVEATAEFVDTVSYSLNILCAWYTRKRSVREASRVEFWTAVASTGLLLLCGIRIGVQSYEQVVCSKDLDFDPNDVNDVPCGLLQGRPHPQMVIITASILLVSYIPPFMYLFLKGGIDLESFRPDENINKASAMLHICFDVVLQISLLIASLIMIYWPVNSIMIDATTSVLMMIVMISMTSAMWILYHGTEAPKSTIRGQPADMLESEGEQAS